MKVQFKQFKNSKWDTINFIDEKISDSKIETHFQKLGGVYRWIRGTVVVPSKKEIKSYYKNIQQSMTISPRKLYIGYRMRKLLGGRGYSVLDVGCGDCLNLMMMKCYSNNVTGCDLDTSWMKDKMPNLKFFDLDLAKSPNPLKNNNIKYDITCLFDVLEHIPEEDEYYIISSVIDYTNKYLVINTPIGKHDNQIMEREVNISEIINHLNREGMDLYYAETHEVYLFMIWRKR